MREEAGSEQLPESFRKEIKYITIIIIIVVIVITIIITLITASTIITSLVIATSSSAPFYSLSTASFFGTRSERMEHCLSLEPSNG